MKKISILISFILLFSFAAFAQVGINTTGVQPDPSAGLDVSFTNKGLLPPRVALTGTNSAAPVTAPAVGLLVYNIAVAGTSPNDVKAGYYYWNGSKWTPFFPPPGTNVGDMRFWNGTQWIIVPAGTNGQVLTFNNGVPTWEIPCSSVPNAPTPGTHIPSPTQIVWNWTPVAGAVGYKWNTANSYATAMDMDTVTTRTETGLTCSTAYTRYAWAYNACGNSTALTMTQTSSVCCGSSFSISHMAGAVAPIAKTVTYGTVTNIPGEAAKCWITSNLGADHQATAVTDATEASAGWYWQFNRKQGYKHDGTTRTPSTTWISSISESSDWIIGNDPCATELGIGWRIPTLTEWTNVDASGNWTSYSGSWSSALKIHAAGTLGDADGSLSNRGAYGSYWSNTQSSATNGWFLFISSNTSATYGNSKAYGFSLRCVRDICWTAPTAPTSGVHVSSPAQIVWNWNTVSGANGYKWNTANDYASATDMGTATTNTETGLTCNTAYTRYAWAYNACGNSTALTMNQATSSCTVTCGSSFTINHVAGAVAPVAKTVTYGTVTNIPGETSKCWITSNLGADHQATTVSDATEASAGWYWQFNRKQGFKHDGTTRIPNTTWITSISESSNWILANDPCASELGTGWRIPTSTEWVNINAGGSWTNWNGPWNSNLKIHAAGYLVTSNGSLSSRGGYGTYWSSVQYNAANGWNQGFGSGDCTLYTNQKTYGFTVRCIRDY